MCACEDVAEFTELLSVSQFSATIGGISRITEQTLEIGFAFSPEKDFLWLLLGVFSPSPLPSSAFFFLLYILTDRLSDDYNYLIKLLL